MNILKIFKNLSVYDSISVEIEGVIDFILSHINICSDLYHFYRYIILYFYQIIVIKLDT